MVIVTARLAMLATAPRRLRAGPGKLDIHDRRVERWAHVKWGHIKPPFRAPSQRYQSAGRQGPRRSGSLVAIA